MSRRRDPGFNEHNQPRLILGAPRVQRDGEHLLHASQRLSDCQKTLQGIQFFMDLVSDFFGIN